MASINTNASAQIALQNLNAISDRLTATQNRVSTGLKVQGAKDNAAVWAVAQNQRADTKAYESVTSSLNRATSIADVSIAAGESISDLITQLKQKATAAADPGGSDATRTAYNNEFQALLLSIKSFVDNATFDGKNMLNGMADDGVTASTDPLTFLANADATDTISLNRQDFSLAGLGLDPAPDLSSVTGATAALTAVTAALTTVSAGLAEMGAQATQIENHTKFVSKLVDALEIGIGNLVDADLAKESAKLQALQVQQQLGVQSLSIANQAPQIILSLFQN
ncbi:flagellin [Brevundimonas sp.]|uniref:flagellin n=1 Tax=Brevundimonas sp. TaxID=1871086 RepID=UPI003BAD7796